MAHPTSDGEWELQPSSAGKWDLRFSSSTLLFFINSRHIESTVSFLDQDEIARRRNRRTKWPMRYSFLSIVSIQRGSAQAAPEDGAL